MAIKDLDIQTQVYMYVDKVHTYIGLVYMNFSPLIKGHGN